jgi:hypothetical protein
VEEHKEKNLIVCVISFEIKTHRTCSLFPKSMRVYPKDSGLPGSANGIYSSLPLGAVVLLFCESV